MHRCSSPLCTLLWFHLMCFNTCVTNPYINCNLWALHIQERYQIC
ncbi:hypothetical protein GLYMA_18G164166v4 [Glycine max]|nr:hypothetical protein GLYMA_18G164166v4 [Glycine max]KAH1154765.1 hypothetical protein GYH30_050172 [Glycine max]